MSYKTADWNVLHQIIPVDSFTKGHYGGAYMIFFYYVNLIELLKDIRVAGDFGCYDADIRSMLLASDEMEPFH